MERKSVSFDTLSITYRNVCRTEEEPSIELLQTILDENGMSGYQVVPEIEMKDDPSAHLVVSIRLRTVLEERPKYWPHSTLVEDNRQLRRLLAFATAGGMLYTDDGELSDASARPAIDYRRMPPDVIEAALRNRRQHNRVEEKTDDPA